MSLHYLIADKSTNLQTAKYIVEKLGETSRNHKTRENKSKRELDNPVPEEGQ